MMTNRHEIPREEDRPVAVEVSEGMLRVTLNDGWIIATPEQRANVELGFTGIHWPDLDEDLSVIGMLRGNRSPQPKQKTPTEE